MVVLGRNKALLKSELENFLTRSIKCVVNHDKYLISDK